MTRKVALTTGVNSGIGLATALELARRGLHSVGTVRSAAKAEVVARAAAAAGVGVETMLLDVTDAAGCERVVDEVRPDVLVNNAGFSGTGAVEDVDDDEARLVLETMVVAPMRLARLSLAHQRACGGGAIVNVSSIYGRTAGPLTGWYQGAKHALEALTDALRLEVARDGIRVVLVEPGGFRTGIWDRAEQEVAARAGSRYERAYEQSMHRTRQFERVMGDPRQVARVIGHAVTTPLARTRYLVGYDAQALAALDRLTPGAVKDRVLRIISGL